jgi:hypothetical protein
VKSLVACDVELQKEHESLLVFSHSNSGVIRVVGMIEYLEEEKAKRRIGFGVE